MTEVALKGPQYARIMSISTRSPEEDDDSDEELESDLSISVSSFSDEDECKKSDDHNGNVTPDSGVRKLQRKLSRSVRTITRDKTNNICNKYFQEFCDIIKQKWTRSDPPLLYLLIYNLINPFIVIALSATVGNLAELTFMFPSLGPTAFLHYAIPSAPPSSPKNTLIGHLTGIICGMISLQVTGLYYNDIVWDEGTVVERISCAALSVGLVCFFMILFHVEHPPAAATTLIVSLGILKTPIQLLSMMGAVLLLTIWAFIINRLFRKDVVYPIWSIDIQCAPKPKKKRKKIRKNRLDTLGYNEMDLRNMNGMNAKIKRLQRLKYENLTTNNFAEYFAIAKELKKEKYMKILIKYAFNNLNKLKVLLEIPYSTRILLKNINADSFK